MHGQTTKLVWAWVHTPQRKMNHSLPESICKGIYIFRNEVFSDIFDDGVLFDTGNPLFPFPVGAYNMLPWLETRDELLR